MYVKTIVGGANAGIRLFHTNANATPGVNPGNLVKQGLRNGALAAPGTAAPVDISMERGTYPGESRARPSSVRK